MNATLDLFARFSPVRLPPNVCVVWKLLHIAKRHNGTRGAVVHHPSTLNGFHHWLNRFTVGLARAHGVGIVDPTALTRHLTPRGWKPADAHGRGGSDGDVYHGFDDDLVVPEVVNGLCDACAIRNRVAKSPLAK